MTSDEITIFSDDEFIRELCEASKDLAEGAKELQNENDKLRKENAKLQKEVNELQRFIQQFSRKEVAKQRTIEFHRKRLKLSEDATREEIEKANEIHHERRKLEIKKCKERKKELKNQWRAEKDVARKLGTPFDTWKEMATKLGIHKPKKFDRHYR